MCETKSLFILILLFIYCALVLHYNPWILDEVIPKRRVFLPIFTFTWKIENFEYCFHDGGEYLSSPTFEIDDSNKSTWLVLLRPRKSLDDPNYISFYLYKFENDMDDVMLQFEIGIIASDGDYTNKPEINRYLFSKEEGGFVYPNFCERTELSDNKRHYLPKGTLTIQIKISSETAATPKYRTALTKIETLSLNHVYTGQLSEQNFTSFFICRKTIRLYVKLKLDSNEKKFLVKVINLDDSGFGTCELFVYDSSGVTQHVGEYDHLFKKDEEWIMKFTPNSYESCLEKAIKIQMHFKLSTGKVHSQYENWSTHSITSEDDHGLKNLNKDYLSIYTSKKMCDIKIISADGLLFEAHKSILGARSPVFRRMLDNSNSKASIQNKIEVKDINSKTLDLLLRFIYSSKIENIELELTYKLYSAADKYQLLDLRQICCDTMVDGLDINNVFDVLKLADMHSDLNLKKNLKLFLLHNGAEAFETKRWKSMLETDTKLTSEVMQWMFPTISKMLNES